LGWDSTALAILPTKGAQWHNQTMASDDYEAIRSLLNRYYHYVDTADTEAWLSLYTDDGSLDIGVGEPPIRGKDALRAFGSTRRPGVGIHVSVNPIITIDGDVATIESYVIVIGRADDPRIVLAGRYEDRLRRVEGAWRFVSRRLERQMRPTT
jgi:ketosteroid isomerase-like protein